MSHHDAPPPDTIVRTALQLLPVPPHADDFWARLERALDAEPVASAPLEPRVLVSAPAGLDRSTPPGTFALERDPALALVPSALRRTSNAVLVAVAVAAVVVVALAGNTLMQERNGTQGVSSDDTTAESAALDALVADAQPDAATVSTMSTDGEASSSDAVLTWVGHLGSGDGEAAWAAMGPTSQAHFGSQDAFEAQMTDLSEGYGAWSAAEPDDVLVTPVLSSDEGVLAVVTLVGDVEQEGTTQHRADAFPVRLVDGEATVEPFAFAGEIEVVVPDEETAPGERSPLPAGEELVVVVPRDAAAPLLRLDDGDTIVCGEAEGTELVPLDGAPGQRCSYLPERGLGAGEHTLTVAFLGADGASISAESLLFEAA